MLRVLFWGSDPNAPVPYFRGGQFAPYWAENDVEAEYAETQDVSLDMLDWPEVVVFRRWYARLINGRMVADDTTQAAWHRCGEMGIGRVYDTDDNDFLPRTDNPNEAWVGALGVRDLIRRMVREASVVTFATPTLLRAYGPLTRCGRVIRNAVDCPLYHAERPATERPTALFYGSAARLKDYFGTPWRGRREGGHAYAAVREAGLRSIWLGHDAGPVPVEFDTVVPYIRDLPTYFRTLGSLPADIGLAPLIGDEFDQCKSELHWLEFSAAGLPVVAQRLMGSSPYGVVRHGVDGLLARGRQEWIDAVAKLAREPTLRADLVAAARERMITEYDPRRRATEWADAFRAAKEAA